MAKTPIKKVTTKKSKAKANDGSQSNFVVYEGLDGIRANPGMYLGDQGEDMAYRAGKEPVDNSLDEYTAGRNNLIEMVVNYDTGLHIIADGAKGIPTDLTTLKDGSKESVMTAAFSRVHAGGKFDDSAYKTSAGTHGVGVAAVNAVSTELRVWSNYKGKSNFQSWKLGEFSSGSKPIIRKVDADVAGLLRDKPSKYGTIVAYVLDQTVVSADAKRNGKLPKDFRVAEIDPTRLGNWLRTISMLNPKLQIRLKMIRNKKVKEFTFENKKDLAAVVSHMCEERELTVTGKPFVLKTDYVACAIGWTEHPDADNFFSFVNTSPTADGGWHVRGFIDALVAAIKPYHNAKGNKLGFSSNDLLIGLVGMFDWRMHGARYTSQVKDKLSSRVEKEVQEILQPAFEEYFKKNKRVATMIIKRAQAMSKGREELAGVVKAMSEVTKKNKGSALPAFLATALKAKPHERELIVVEGDSAGGTATNARDPSYQEVMKAGGKPLNGLKASLSKVLKHKEVQGMLVALGADIKTLDPKAENPILSTDKLRVGNVLFLSDADPDGYHINVLFLAVIYRLLPDLMREGRVYVIDAPLYIVMHKGKLYGGATFEECRSRAPKAVHDREIIRAKGWGEVDADVLEPIAFNPETRRLIQINPFASAEAERVFRGIVAEDAVHRRRLLGLED